MWQVGGLHHDCRLAAGRRKRGRGLRALIEAPMVKCLVDVMSYAPRVSHDQSSTPSFSSPQRRRGLCAVGEVQIRSDLAADELLRRMVAAFQSRLVENEKSPGLHLGSLKWLPETHRTRKGRGSSFCGAPG
jgi:hypothetical protein